MGQSCGPQDSSCGGCNDTSINQAIDDKDNKPQRRLAATDSKSSSDEYETGSKHLTPNETNTISESSVDRVPSPPPQGSQSSEKVIAGFKDAIKNGDESLANGYIEEYPDLDLFSISFENGDNCLQVAVRNSSYKLIYYLLNNAVSVKSFVCIYT